MILYLSGIFAVLSLTAIRFTSGQIIYCTEPLQTPQGPECPAQYPADPTKNNLCCGATPIPGQRPYTPQDPTGRSGAPNPSLPPPAPLPTPVAPPVNTDPNCATPIYRNGQPDCPDNYPYDPVRRLCCGTQPINNGSNRRNNGNRRSNGRGGARRSGGRRAGQGRQRDSTRTGRRTVRVRTPASSCVDKSAPGRPSDCAANKHRCNATDWYDLMTEQCQKTCGRCNQQPAGNGSNASVGLDCRDGTKPDGTSDCPANKNLCQDPNYKTMMAAECPLTCGTCRSGGFGPITRKTIVRRNLLRNPRQGGRRRVLRDGGNAQRNGRRGGAGRARRNKQGERNGNGGSVPPPPPPPPPRRRNMDPKKVDDSTIIEENSTDSTPNAAESAVLETPESFKNDSHANENKEMNEKSQTEELVNGYHVVDSIENSTSPMPPSNDSGAFKIVKHHNNEDEFSILKWEDESDSSDMSEDS